jgi:hypothetical protein
MLIPFGVLSAAAFAPVAGGDYELIESAILTSNESSVTFSNLGDYSSTYKHLQIRATVRTDRAGAADGGIIRFNGDSGANYAHHVLAGSGSSVSSFASTSATEMVSLGGVGNTATANAFSAAVVDILDAYSTTKNKTVRSLHGVTSINLGSGVRLNTASLTSIELRPQLGTNFLTSSRFSIYGVRG